MSKYYSTGTLKTDVSANGVRIVAGTWVVVSVEQDSLGLFVAVCSSNKNVFLPFFDTDYESLIHNSFKKE